MIELFVKSLILKALTNEDDENMFPFVLGQIKIKAAAVGHNPLDYIDQVDKDGDTPLMAAILLKKNDIAKKLIEEEGADFRALNYKGQNCLHWAGIEGNIEMVPYLKEKGLDINAKDKESENNLLHLAILDDRTEFVEEIVHHEDLDLLATNNEMKTAVHLSVERHNLRMLRAIIGKMSRMDFDANLKILDADGLTPHQRYIRV